VEEAVTPDRVMQLGLGFWGSKALLSSKTSGGFDYTGAECCG
jgi:hypothetical protein